MFRAVGSRRAVRYVAAVLALFGLIAGGCARGASVSDVSVTAGGVTVTLPAALSCYSPNGATEISCAGGDNDDDAPHLAVSPGAPITIDVPKKVGDTPWVVVFSYIDANGDTQGDRTGVFAPEKQYSYRLVPPDGAQLTRVEVQSLTAAPGAGGGVEFPAVGTWVLVVDPVGGAVTTGSAGQ